VHRRPTVALPAATLIVIVLGVLPVRSGQPPAAAPATTLAAFLNSPVDLRSYRAIRRLSVEARGGRMTASLVAETELLESGELRYTILNEEGSEMLRRRVLRAVLETEREAKASGESASNGLSRANYEFVPAASAPSDNGLARIAIRPRRPHKMLVDGHMLIDPATADLVRVEGRLSRRPSFWTRTVELVRHYARIGGVRVPVATQSTAQVLFAGPSTFTMTYEYESVNGVTVTRATTQP
jgi:hypothetical protein